MAKKITVLTGGKVSMRFNKTGCSFKPGRRRIRVMEISSLPMSEKEAEVILTNSSAEYIRDVLAGKKEDTVLLNAIADYQQAYRNRI